MGECRITSLLYLFINNEMNLIKENFKKKKNLYSMMMMKKIKIKTLIVLPRFEKKIGNNKKKKKGYKLFLNKLQ